MEEPVDVAPDNKELPVHHRVMECEKVPGQDKRPASPRPNARTSIVLQPLAAVAERRPHIPAATSFTGTPRRMLWRRMSILTSLRPEGPHAPVVSTAQGQKPHPTALHGEEYSCSLANSRWEAARPAASPAREVEGCRGCTRDTSTARGAGWSGTWSRTSAGRS